MNESPAIINEASVRRCPHGQAGAISRRQAARHVLLCLASLIALSSGNEPSPEQVFSDHQGSVLGLAFSPDGAKLATCSRDGSVKIRNSEWRLEKTYTDHRKDVYGVAFSPAGDLLASCGADGAVRIVEIATGKLRNLLHGHTATVRAIAFSPDGATLVSVGEDSIVNIWKLLRWLSTKSLWAHCASEVGGFHPKHRFIRNGKHRPNDPRVELQDIANGARAHGPFRRHRDFGCV